MVPSLSKVVPSSEKMTKLVTVNVVNNYGPDADKSATKQVAPDEGMCTCCYRFCVCGLVSLTVCCSRYAKATPIDITNKKQGRSSIRDRKQT